MERCPGDGQLFQGPRRRDEREPQTAAGGQVRGRRGRREGGRRQVEGERGAGRHPRGLTVCAEDGRLPSGVAPRTQSPPLPTVWS